MPMVPIGRNLILPFGEVSEALGNQGAVLFGYRIFTNVEPDGGPLLDIRVATRSNEFQLPGSTVFMVAQYRRGFARQEYFRFLVEESSNVFLSRVDRFDVTELDVAMYAGASVFQP